MLAEDMTPAEADGVLFDGTMHCADEIPLSFSAGAHLNAEVLGERNASALRTLGRLAEHTPETSDDKNSREADISRLEAKLDLALELIGTMLSLQRPPPPRADIRLSARGLVWHDAPALAAGATGHAFLYLHPALPQPLELPVRVIAVDEAASPRRVWLRFESVTEALAHELERYTFRRHRRAIALLRAKG